LAWRLSPGLRLIRGKRKVPAWYAASNLSGSQGSLSLLNNVVELIAVCDTHFPLSHEVNRPMQLRGIELYPHIERTRQELIVWDYQSKFKKLVYVVAANTFRVQVIEVIGKDHCYECPLPSGPLRLKLQVIEKRIDGFFKASIERPKTG
jgi:hypothetical protein